MKKLFVSKKNSKIKAVNIFTICLSFLFIINLVWLGIVFVSNPVAYAETLNNQPVLISKSSPVENLEQKAKKTLDQTMGSGTSEQIEGRIEQTQGKIQQKTGKITGQTEGAMKQVKGKAKEDIGKVKEKSEKVGSQVKETSEGVWEKVQDFFGD